MPAILLEPFAIPPRRVSTSSPPPLLASSPCFWPPHPLGYHRRYCTRIYHHSSFCAPKARQKKRKPLAFCTVRSLISPAIFRSCEDIAQNSRLLLDPMGPPTIARKKKQPAQLQAASIFPSWIADLFPKASVQNSLCRVRDVPPLPALLGSRCAKLGGGVLRTLAKTPRIGAYARRREFCAP